MVFQEIEKTGSSIMSTVTSLAALYSNVELNHLVRTSDYMEAFVIKFLVMNSNEIKIKTYF